MAASKTKLIRIYVRKGKDDDIIYWQNSLIKNKIKPSQQTKKIVAYLLGGDKINNKFVIPENVSEVTDGRENYDYSIGVMPELYKSIDNAIDKVTSPVGGYISRSEFIKMLIRSTFDDDSVKGIDRDIIELISSKLSASSETNLKEEQDNTYIQNAKTELLQHAEENTESKKYNRDENNIEAVGEINFFKQQRSNNGIKLIPGLLNMGDQFNS